MNFPQISRIEIDTSSAQSTLVHWQYSDGSNGETAFPSRSLAETYVCELIEAMCPVRLYIDGELANIGFLQPGETYDSVMSGLKQKACH